MKKAQGHDLYAHYSVAEKQLSSSRMPYIGSYENELCMAKIRKGEQRLKHYNLSTIPKKGIQNQAPSKRAKPKLCLKSK